MEFIDFTKKYLPNTFEESILHKKQIIFIKNIKTIQNTLFYGYEGKTVLINLLLNNIFNKIIIKSNDFKNKQIKCKYSDYHLEINLKTTHKNIDLVIDLIKEYSSTSSIINSLYKIIVLYNFDTIDFKYQYQFRTLIEKVVVNTRFIIHSNNLSKIIDPIKSRCLLIRIPTINNREAFEFIKNISKITKDAINKIIENSKLNGFLSIRKIMYNMFIKEQSKINKIRYNINNSKDLEYLFEELISKNNIKKKIDNLNIITIYLIQINYSIQDIIKFLLNKILEMKNISIDKKLDIIRNTAIQETMINKNRLLINIETYLVYLLSELESLKALSDLSQS